MAAQLTSLLSFSSSHALANYKGDTSCFKVLHSSSHSARRRNRRVFCSSAQAPARETQAHPLSIWLESRDVPTKRLGSQPKIVEGKLCLVATRPTSSGQTLAAIPQKAWLTQQTVSQSPIGIFVEELDGWLQICLLLLHERSKQQSAWGPYLASLPREVDLLLVLVRDRAAATAGGHSCRPLLRDTGAFPSPMVFRCHVVRLRLAGLPRSARQGFSLPF